jgi:hypothetical protein
MSNVTVTDKHEVALMETDDIRKWISLHTRALEDESMKEHWTAIKDDLQVLTKEYELRNPLVAVLTKLNETLESLRTTILQHNKENKDGNSKD